MNAHGKIWSLRNGLTGLLVVLWLGLSFVNAGFDEPTISAPSDSQEETQDERKRQPPVLKLSEAVQSSIHIDVDFHSFLLDEVEQDSEEDERNSNGDLFRSNLSKHFKVLLRKIISTNAP